MLVPCFVASPGTSIVPSTPKSFAIVSTTSYDTQASFAAFDGSVTTPDGESGFRQIASLDGNSGFWLSGGGTTNAGFRYLGSITQATAAPIIGQSAGYPGYYGTRGVTVFSNALYVASSPADAPFNRVYKIGSGAPPTTSTTTYTPQAGMPQYTMWTFM